VHEPQVCQGHCRFLRKRADPFSKTPSWSDRLRKALLASFLMVWRLLGSSPRAQPEQNSFVTCSESAPPPASRGRNERDKGLQSLPVD
jgi:hypothetical protein